MRRAVPWLIGLTVAHFLASAGVFLLVFSLGMKRFDTGELAGVGEHVLQAVSTVLLCPVIYPLLRFGMNRWFSGLLGYLLVAANSFLWAVVIWWGYQAWNRRRSSQRLPVA